MDKPFAASCIENCEPIFAVLEPRLRGCRSLLEIGSGTGQHAVYFAPRLAHLRWHTSDLVENHAGIRAWLDEARLPNVEPPIALDVMAGAWPGERFDAVFSANTAHIMPEMAVEAMLRGVARVLQPQGSFLLYGPFNYGGRYTAPSNARFDAWLRQRDPAMGIRDVAWLDEIADAAGMARDEDIAMPENNRTLVWKLRERQERPWPA